MGCPGERPDRAREKPAQSVSHLGKKTRTEMARCYTPTFPYQRHFDGYVQMSEEDAALFWEIDDHPTPHPGGSCIGPALADRDAPMPEETVPEIKTSTKPVPSDKPEDPRRTGVSYLLGPRVTARTLSLPIQLAWPVCRREREP